MSPRKPRDCEVAEVSENKNGYIYAVVKDGLLTMQEARKLADWLGRFVVWSKYETEYRAILKGKKS
jgi:hypothetical protein